MKEEKVVTRPSADSWLEATMNEEERDDVAAFLGVDAGAERHRQGGVQPGPGGAELPAGGGDDGEPSCFSCHGRKW